jgi:hypothetical protein
MPRKIRAPWLAPGLIQAPSVPDKENIVFSFSFFQADHSKCNASGRDANYFRALLQRFKAVGQFTVKQFRTMHAGYNKALRVHPIEWSHPKISQAGFQIPQRQDLDEQAWQFSLSEHESGRVHGFLIDRVFHVVWLDPDHNLYPWEAR